MQLLVVILNNSDRLTDVVSALVEAGIPGGTIIESQGLGSILSSDIPIFAGFRHMMAGSKPFNHTILSVVPDESVVKDALRIINDVLGPDASKDGILFSVPVDFFSLLGVEPLIEQTSTESESREEDSDGS